MAHTLAALVERYIETTVKDEPVHATYLGIHDYDAELGAFEKDALAGKRSRTEAILSDLEGLEPEALTVEERIDRAALMARLRTDLFERDELRVYERQPALYLMTVLSGCHLLIAYELRPLEERARNLVGRLEAAPTVLRAMRENLVDPPAIFAAVGAGTAAAGAAFVRSVAPRIADAVPGLGRELKRAAGSAAAAFEESAAFLSGLAEGGEAPFHVGRDRYEWLLRESHLLDFDSDELRAMGEGVMEETKARARDVAAEIDPQADWSDVLEGLKDEHPSKGDLRDFYSTCMARARDFVLEHDLVTVPPGERLDVVDTPVFLREIIPYAAYLPPGPFEEAQQGLFYVTPVDDALSGEDQERQLRGHSVHTVPVVALHEGYPGHHLQLVRANACSRKVRRVLWDTVFIEGWALYCEEMMRERGFYSDPKTRLGQLKENLWRAARVVVDVDLQRGDMTYEEAIEFMIREVHLERVNAAAEVKRYTSHPTQPSSYMIGKREIMRIRRETEAQRGGDFDLKEFHDSLLDLGSIQPGLVRVALGLGGGGGAR